MCSFELAVNGAGRQEDVDALARRVHRGGAGAVDVVLVTAGQAQMTGPCTWRAMAAPPRNRPATRWEAGLDHIDAQFPQRVRDLQLLARVHARPGDCSPSRSVVSKMIRRSVP